jgi:predicted DNA-binding protein YlxM (UPF0122 family)
MSSVIFDTKTKRTSKRCSRGSRKDKKTQICVQYAKVKTFSDLKDQNISETETTVSVEGLGEKNKDGAIIKLYHKGDLHSQKYVSHEKVKKAQQKSKDQIKKTEEVMKKISKKPELMFKDKKFRQFQKKMDDAYKRKKRNNKTSKGGDGDSDSSTSKPVVVSPNYTNYYIDNNIVPNADADTKGLIDTHLPYQEWWSNIMSINLLTTISSLEILGSLEPTVTGQAAYNASLASIQAAAPALGFDILGSLFMIILNTVPLMFPNVESVDTFVTIAQYIFYTVYIPLNIFTFWASAGWWTLSFLIMPAINLFYMQSNKPPPDVFMTKNDLYNMENQQFQQNQMNMDMDMMYELSRG